MATVYAYMRTFRDQVNSLSYFNSTNRTLEEGSCTIKTKGPKNASTYQLATEIGKVAICSPDNFPKLTT